MPCNPETLRSVPLFSLFDEDEICVLANEVEVKDFVPRQRIYKIGDNSGRAYVMVSGKVRVTIFDEDHQEVVVDEPSHGEFFGFASMLEQTPHQTNAIALEQTRCLEVDRHDIQVLLERKPHAGMDMLTVLGRQFHAAQQLVRLRAARNPNEVIGRPNGQATTRSAAGRSRYARRCRCAGGVGRRHRARRRQIHRRVLRACRRVRRWHNRHCRIDAGGAKLRDVLRNRTGWRARCNFRRRERQSRAIGRRPSRH